ncbi:MAG: hypothetical protein NTV30_08935 [Chloroflexi bacterium]|nr:hypothetical protein [Chloroflexota bacterium]
MPIPNVDEKKDDFLSRCMGDKEANNTFPRNDQRYAFCISQWNKKSMAEWDTQYVNNLPDSAFAYIMPGGEKDNEDKTVPRALRKLPFKNTNGQVDLDHVRNAIARAPQTVGIPQTEIANIQEKLRNLLEKQNASEFNKFFSIVDIKNFDFSENNPANEIQVLPVGVWNHPVYGKINITESDLTDFANNFNDNLRKDLPITEGHSVGSEEKPAIGWFKQLINKGRDGLWAVVEWTKEGMDLLSNKAYKYFSPEFFTNYEDPESRKTYKNVLVGGALTNRPYFKGLKEVVLSELTIYNENTMLEDILKKSPADLTDEEVKEIKEAKDTLTPEQQEAFKDIISEGKEKTAEELAAEEKVKADAEAELKAKEEADAKVKAEAEAAEEKQGAEMIQVSKKSMSFLEKQATEGVKAIAELRKTKAEGYVNTLIFSETNKKATFLPRSQKKVVEFLLSLSEDQVEKFKGIVAEMPKAELFAELGVEDGVEVKASEQVQKLVKIKMEKNTNLGYREALEQVFAESPELAKMVNNE